jgi:hypothetical protein
MVMTASRLLCLWSGIHRTAATPRTKTDQKLQFKPEFSKEGRRQLKKADKLSQYDNLSEQKRRHGQADASKDT